MDCLFYRVVRPIINILFKSIYRPTYKGLDNIPKDSNFILAGNHTDNFDCILLITSTKRTIHFLAKDSLLKGPKKLIFKAMGIIPVDRSIHDKNALNSAINTLNEGKVIGIFPEGTINETNDIILPFKFGAVKMASETNSKIVPFIITNKFIKFKKSVEIEFLKPYKVSNDLEKENKKLEKIISDKLKEKR